MVKAGSYHILKKGSVKPTQTESIHNELDMISQLADMKEVDYRNTLAIASIIEVLLEKKIITRDDIAKKAKSLDNFAFDQSKEQKLD